MHKGRFVLIVVLLVMLLVGCNDDGGEENLQTSSIETSEEKIMEEGEKVNQDIIEGSAIGEYQKISPEDAYKLLSEDENIILLDVRTQDEWEQERIEGSILIADYDIAAKVLEAIPNTEAKIFVYCRSGRRSEDAVRTMVELGYANVYDLGGIIDWPYDTVSES